MFEIKRLEKEDIQKVIDFERELRKQEADTYYWEPDETYARQLEMSFDESILQTLIQSRGIIEKCTFAV